MPFRPFDYGNVLAQATNIERMRTGNQLASMQLSQLANQIATQEQLENALAGGAGTMDELIARGVNPLAAQNWKRNHLANEMGALQLQQMQDALADSQRQQAIQGAMVWDQPLQMLQDFLEAGDEESAMRFAELILEDPRMADFIPDGFEMPEDAQSLGELVREQRMIVDSLLPQQMMGSNVLTGAQANALFGTPGAFAPDSAVFVDDSMRPTEVASGAGERFRGARKDELSRQAPALSALRTQYVQESRPFTMVQDGMSRVQIAYELAQNTPEGKVSGPSDTALILNIARMMQPEMRGLSGDAIQDVQMLSGISAQLGQAWQRIRNDNTLTPAQRRSIKRLAEEFYARQASSQRRINERYQREARALDLPFEVDPLGIPKPDPEAQAMLRQVVQDEGQAAIELYRAEDFERRYMD